MFQNCLKQCILLWSMNTHSTTSRTSQKVRRSCQWIQCDWFDNYYHGFCVPLTASCSVHYQDCWLGLHTFDAQLTGFCWSFLWFQTITICKFLSNWEPTICATLFFLEAYVVMVKCRSCSLTSSIDGLRRKDAIRSTPASTSWRPDVTTIGVGWWKM